VCDDDDNDDVQRTRLMAARQSQLERTISAMSDSLASKQETLDTLRLQVVIYRDDFQAERQDRERARTQISQLQAQLDRLSQQQVHSQPPPASLLLSTASTNSRQARI